MTDSSTGFHPYLAYKSSSLEWLGNVPEHWKISAVKQSYQIQLGKMLQTARQAPDDRETPYLKAVHVQWLSVETADPLTMWANPREIAQFSIQRGDLLVCEGGEGGRSGIVWADVDGYIIQNALHRIRPKGQNSNEFLQYVMYVAASYGWFDALNDKATIAHFTREKLAAFRLPLPLPSEQTAIVRYLDHADVRIRRYISAKQKLIALLEEEKQAVINRAVTRGLDPNVPIKPSGVEWLGDIPAHWEVIPLRRLAISRCDGPFGSGLKSSHYTDQGIRVVRLQNIGHAEFNNSDAAFIARSHYGTLGDHTVEPEDLLVAGLGDKHHPAGRACVAPSFIVPAMVKADCFRFRLVRQRINPEFTALQLTATAVDASSLLSTGATRQRTNLQATAARPIAVPPRREQVVIVEYLEKVTTGIDAAIDRARRQIELLQEYRTRLIADVVTGQRDVRGAAAQLPEVDEWNPIGKHLLVGATYQEPSDSDTRRA